MLAVADPIGSAAEMVMMSLVLLLATIIDPASHDYGAAKWASTVLANASSYVHGRVWRPPKELSTQRGSEGKDAWVFNKLNEAIDLCRRSDAHRQTLERSFLKHTGKAVSSSGTLKRYLDSLRDGSLRGVKWGTRATESPRRSVYVAPQAAKYLSDHLAALIAVVEEEVAKTPQDEPVERSGGKKQLKEQAALDSSAISRLPSELEAAQMTATKATAALKRARDRQQDKVTRRVQMRAATAAERTARALSGASSAAEHMHADNVAELEQDVEQLARDLQTANATVAGLRQSANEKAAEIAHLTRRLARTDSSAIRRAELARAEAR